MINYIRGGIRVLSPEEVIELRRKHDMEIYYDYYKKRWKEIDQQFPEAQAKVNLAISMAADTALSKIQLMVDNARNRLNTKPKRGRYAKKK